ncbi:MAG: hypothetical protein ACRCV6_01555 [Formosimonas sp.]
MPKLNEHSERAQVRELLPWLSNGSLNDAQSQWLNAWLATHPDDAEIHAEFAWLQRSAAQYKHTVDVPPANQGLDILLARIHAEQAVAHPKYTLATTTNEYFWTKLKSWLATPALSLSMLSLLVLQTGVIGWLMHQDNPPMTMPTQPTQSITPLSGEQTTAPAGMALLQVTFLPTANERDIRATLSQVEAQIISGPSALGVYVLALPLASLERSQSFLRRQSKIVESVSRP